MRQLDFAHTHTRTRSRAAGLSPVRDRVVGTTHDFNAEKSHHTGLPGSMQRIRPCITPIRFPSLVCEKSACHGHACLCGRGGLLVWQDARALVELGCKSDRQPRRLQLFLRRHDRRAEELGSVRVGHLLLEHGDWQLTKAVFPVVACTVLGQFSDVRDLNGAHAHNGTAAAAGRAEECTVRWRWAAGLEHGTWTWAWKEADFCVRARARVWGLRARS